MKLEELKQSYRLAKTKTFVVGCFVFSAICITLMLLGHLYPDIGVRFLGVTSLWLVTIAMLFNLILSYQSVLLRSFKEEPYMIVSIIISIGLLFVFFVAPKVYSFDIVMIGYMLIYSFTTIFIAYPIFLRFWERNLNE